MRLSRRRLLSGAAATAIGAAGVYELAERLSAKPSRPTATRARRPEQHVVDGVEVVVDGGVEVVVPPLHHRVLTAKLTIDDTAGALRDAREALERMLAALEVDYPASPAGLVVTVAWGLSYFERYVAGQARRALPVDLRASAERGRTVRVLEPTERFPSDPDRIVLEENDVAVLLRSDHLDAVEDAHRRIVGVLKDVLAPASVRKGFIGGGFRGGVGLPKQLALMAGVPGADLIPDGAELYLGFTSTQRHALGAPRIANFETLGYADMRDGYFVGGTHMHLSHLHENVNAWYLNFDHRERVDAMFRPGLQVPASVRTVSQDRAEAQTADRVRADYARHGVIGHSGALQSASRLDRDVTGPDGTVYPKGSAVPHRADFNTLDNPFAWSVDPVKDRLTSAPDTGVHFVVFNPTSDDFRRVRLAMDGVMPGDAPVEIAPRSRGQGINSVFHTTHRQNFLVPPRAHRSFPLSEQRP